MATLILRKRRSERSGIVLEPQNLQLAVQRRDVVRVLLATAAVLTLLSLAGQVARFYMGLPHVLGLVPLFYVDLENNVPTWYQSLAFALAALILAALGAAAVKARAPFARHWTALSLIFLFLSLDEMASIHEATMAPVQRFTGPLEGVWQPAWVVLGVAALAIVGGMFLRFFLHLRPPERLQVLAAAGLFVGGAVGMEMATASLYMTSDPAYKVSFTYALLAHVEEALEMLGLIVFIDFLLRRLSRTASFSLAVGD